MKHISLIIALVAVFFSTSAMAAKDKFNRSDLGSKWVAVAGTQSISSNKFVGTSGSLGYYKKSREDTSVSVKIYLSDANIAYGAVAVGDIANGANAYVKLQAQAENQKFTNAAFYTGNNSGEDFFTLTSQIPSPATLSVSFCGTVATMTITSAAPTQVYNFDYGTSFGVGGGLGTYAEVALDNYKSKPGGCDVQNHGVWIKKGASKVRDLSHSM